MTQKEPRVSIGLAVFNGAKYLEQAIDSILAQTFTDFELIISDNASTDSTADICRKYMAQEPRIRYCRNETNIGGAKNENRTFELCRGEYFRWAADDDRVAPELLAHCVEVLDQDPSVILCSSRVVEIDENGEVLNVISENRGTSSSPSQRFYELLQEDHNCEATYGLIRSDILRKTRLQQNYTGSDRTLLCELSLYGKFHEVQDPLFFKRYHSRNMYVDMRARMSWFNPAHKGKIVFPYCHQFVDYLVTIYRVPISLSEKLRCYGHMVRWSRAHFRNMVGDVVLALIALTHPARDPYNWRNEDKDIYNWE